MHWHSNAGQHRGVTRPFGTGAALRCALCLFITASLANSTRLYGDDLEDAHILYLSGKYEECSGLSESMIAKTPWSEMWRQLRIRCCLQTGRYADALETLEQSLGRFASSIQLRWLGHEVYRMNNRPEMATAMLDQVDALVQRMPWRYSDAAGRVILGRVVLARGYDARQVLELVYDRVKKEQPDFAEAYTASGDLALDKQDYGVAVAEFTKALKLSPDDPDLHFKLALALAPSDTGRAQAALVEALAGNPNHLGALLTQAEQQIDAERYDLAALTLSHVLEINPAHPEAWAYRAVLAHLDADPHAENVARQEALCAWSSNPRVDHLIGRKLSEKYRFAEGAQYQRRAIEADASFLPAKIQLSQDLLRLGQEEEGWQLAEQVHQQDGYNVLAFNLVTLQESIRRFRTLADEDFVVRMDAHEAAIYGAAVVALLHRAKQTLCERYEVQLDEPVTVEIFPRQEDFAIRTFGLPGGAGFLGVCFGNVITANSPASQGETPSNWQAVLWHEFCHVVTLNKTDNKMPRWLSEGISVYEERQADNTWGQTMTPGYREMILGGELTPVSQLSSAFLSPASPVHLQFAYFESALVVEFLIERFGLDVLNRVLADLRVGMPIGESLARYTMAAEKLDEEFAEFALNKAEALAPELDFSRPELEEDAKPEALRDWLAEHPDNFWALQLQARQRISDGQWDGARAPLERLIELYPGDVQPGGAYEMLAEVHRELDQPQAERAALEAWSARSADAVTAYRRLLELCVAAEDWQAVAKHARKLQAVNPLTTDSHRWLAKAAEELGSVDEAIAAYRSWLQLEPVDPAGTHFRLARLLYETGDRTAAKRHVLQALEAAPRYREAHRLLLDLVAEEAANRPEPTRE